MAETCEGPPECSRAGGGEESGIHLAVSDYLNVCVPGRKLSFTQIVPPSGLQSCNTTEVFTMFEDLEDNEKGGDDMNEMDMPNPGSIQHFERLFYPKIPCGNCGTCYVNFG